jgi:hypothetical protein
MSLFKKAERHRAWLKLGITGGPGDGKTYSALRLATGLANGGKIAVLDTENNSASLYADAFSFDVLEIRPPFSDDQFTNGINAAIAEHYSVIIIDSFSHSWEGTLDFKAALDARGGNSYTNWNAAGKKFKAVMAAVLQSPAHVICCLRSKMEYVLETDIRGKQVPRKIGLQPVARDGVEYEYACVFDCNSDHHVTVSKDRTGLFSNAHFQVTEGTGRQILDWLNSAPAEPTAKERLALELSDVEPATLSAYLIDRGVSSDGSIGSVSDAYAAKALLSLPRLKEAINQCRQGSKEEKHFLEG